MSCDKVQKILNFKKKGVKKRSNTFFKAKKIIASL